MARSGAAGQTQASRKKAHTGTVRNSTRSERQESQMTATIGGQATVRKGFFSDAFSKVVAPNGTTLDAIIVGLREF
jgi:hypothetical protein